MQPNSNLAWPHLDMDKVAQLQDDVLKIGRPFQFRHLFEQFLNHKGKNCEFLAMNSDIALSSRFALMEESNVRNSPYNSRWRFGHQLADIDDPTKLADITQIQNQYRDAVKGPGGQKLTSLMQWYIKHLCSCHHGAIAFVHDHWLYTEQPLALKRDSRQ